MAKKKSISVIYKEMRDLITEVKAHQRQLERKKVREFKDNAIISDFEMAIDHLGQAAYYIENNHKIYRK